ncbi:MAG: hypothetical protein K0R19_3356 [Bacillota bacterium]|nr:hypothetical protein [Bacillota bacterium]
MRPPFNRRSFLIMGIYSTLHFLLQASFYHRSYFISIRIGHTGEDSIIFLRSNHYNNREVIRCK